MLLLREVELLSMVKHPYVVTCVESFEALVGIGRLALHILMDFKSHVGIGPSRLVQRSNSCFGLGSWLSKGGCSSSGYRWREVLN